MAEVINLNRFRKAVRKTEEDEQAARNRARYGRSKAEKQREKALQRLEADKLDGHKKE